MAEGKSGNSSRGVGILTTVFIVFLILKLTETGKVGEWPWVYVCMPLIVQAGFLVLACCCAGVAFVVADSKTTREAPTVQPPI